jgi:hypothetical protein
MSLEAAQSLTGFKELVVTGETKRCRGECKPSMVRVGQCVKKINEKTTLVVISTGDFPMANQ